MMFTAAKEAFNLSQNERIVVELAANFYNAGLWEMPGFEMVYATCDTAFTLILEAFPCVVQSSFTKTGRCPQNGKKGNEPPARCRHPELHWHGRLRP